MFDEIERGYRKGLQEKRFLAYYSPRATIIVILAILLSTVVGIHYWIVLLCATIVFVGLVALFFLKEYRHAHQTIESVRKSKKFSTKLSAYFKADDTQRIEKLVEDLARHRLHTRSDLELTLSYFQSRLPNNTKPNLLEWIFTAVITLSSIVIVTYDSSINTINLHRLFSVVAPTVVVTLIILIPFIVAKLISAGISSSRNKADTSLVQDLAYILVNFERYRTQLEEKTPQPAQNITKHAVESNT